MGLCKSRGNGSQAPLLSRVHAETKVEPGDETRVPLQSHNYVSDLRNLFDNPECSIANVLANIELVVVHDHPLVIVTEYIHTKRSFKGRST